MDVTTKGRLGLTAAKTAVQNPGLIWVTAKSGAKTVPPITKLSFKVGKPLAKRGGRRRFEQITNLSFDVANPLAKRQSRLEQIGETLAEVGEAIFAIGEVVGAAMAAYGPLAARQLGWVEEPKEKRTAPRVAAGAVLGAGAMYFLEPKGGPERRQQVIRLFNNGSPETTGAPPETTGAPPPPTGAPPETT